MLGLRFAISLSKKAEKYSTSTCISTRKNHIHNSFKKPMIEELRCLIAGEVINQCHGCQVDHPSQKQHELCLFKTRQEHTDMFIEKVMMELNTYKIMEKWYPELLQMNLDGSDYLEAYKLWQDIKHNKSHSKALSDKKIVLLSNISSTQSSQRQTMPNDPLIFFRL